MMLYPSGGDLATKSAATEPPAPPLFSTITDCFMDSPNICAKGLATISVGPPGGKGTISLIGLLG